MGSALGKLLGSNDGIELWIDEITELVSPYGSFIGSSEGTDLGF